MGFSKTEMELRQECTSRDDLIYHPAQSTIVQSRLLSDMCNQVLNISGAEIPQPLWATSASVCHPCNVSVYDRFNAPYSRTHSDALCIGD